MTVVNFNKAKKARAKARKRQTADENAVKFGRTKAQIDAERAENTRQIARLDGVKREDPPKS
ncbi:MAG: DUF4169 family protein [Pseudomonadota bacterium]